MTSEEDGNTLGNDIAQYVAANNFTAIPEPSALVLAGLCLAGLGAVGYSRQRCCLRCASIQCG